jgi:SWI/SNF-related matrix-associated actin-dependent regulator of chromatin subfamily A-like protein 1
VLLDYVEATKAFTLRVGRHEGIDIPALVKEHGLDLSIPRSNAHEALLFSRDPYAAATFASCATPGAMGQLAGICSNMAASWKSSSAIYVECPPDKELWPFQLADVEYALARRNTLIGDQPGLGKTPVAICFANEIRAKRVLVICPANIRLQWAKRIREWTTLKWPYTIYPILRGGHGVHPTAEWTIVSYDLARTEGIGKALARQDYDLLILDEAHYLKTIDSGRTRSIFGGGDTRLFDPICHGAGRILALTGTPLPNRPREAYTLARGLCFDAIDWMSEDHFNSRFNPSMRNEVVDPVTGRTKFYVDERSGRHAELQNRLRANFMVRHLKRDVMPQLKLPYFDIIDMEETGPVKQALQAESLLHLDPDNLQELDFFDGHVAAVRRMMGIALAPQVAEYSAMLLQGGEEKLVVFGWHIEVLNILEEKLSKYGVLRIDGRTSAVQKIKRVERFQKEPAMRVMLGNLLSLGTGTDGLQNVCTHAVFAEPDWVAGNNSQAVDRLDRIGQQRTVLADFCVAPGSIAASILAAALRKNQITHQALDAGPSWAGK